MNGDSMFESLVIKQNKNKTSDFNASVRAAAVTVPRGSLALTCAPTKSCFH